MNTTTRSKLLRRAIFFVLPLLLLCCAADAARAQADVQINGFYAVNRAPQGRPVQAAIVIDVPAGFHINANKVAGKFSIPTTIKLDGPEGIRLTPLAFPRGTTRKLKFSNDPLSLYEGRVVVHFNLTFPPNFKTGETELKARVRYQACNDELCYPPVSHEIDMPINVVAPAEQVKRINTQFFGGVRK